MDRERTMRLLDELKENVIQIKRAQRQNIEVSQDLKQQRQVLLDNLLTEFNLSAGQLCRMIGHHQTTWANWRTCKSHPTPRTLCDIRAYIDERMSMTNSEMTGNMLQAIMEADERSIEALNTLARVRSAAGFDLSPALYGKIIEEWRASQK